MTILLDIPLPRPVRVRKRDRVLVTLADGVDFLCARAGKMKAGLLNRAVVAVMRAAATRSEADLRTATKRLQRVAKAA